MKDKYSTNHYDARMELTQRDIDNGFVRMDAYSIYKANNMNQFDKNGLLFHNLKTLLRFGIKNEISREVKALVVQSLRLAREEGINISEILQDELDIINYKRPVKTSEIFDFKHNRVGILEDENDIGLIPDPTNFVTPEQINAWNKSYDEELTAKAFDHKGHNLPPAFIASENSVKSPNKKLRKVYFPIKTFDERAEILRYLCTLGHDVKDFMMYTKLFNYIIIGENGEILLDEFMLYDGYTEGVMELGIEVVR